MSAPEEESDVLWLLGTLLRMMGWLMLVAVLAPVTVGVAFLVAHGALLVWTTAVEPVLVWVGAR